MINQEVSHIFSMIADYLEMNDEKNLFRIRAFRKVSEFCEKYPTDLATLNYYELIKLPGIGEATARDIEEYTKSGKIEYYEKLKRESPVKLEELTRIQGLGPKRVKKLYYALGVKTVKDLEEVAKKGLIRNLDGFGEKSESAILENISFNILNKQRTRIDEALEIAESYIQYLKEKDKGLIQIQYAGSLRRCEETVGDIDILVSSSDSVSTSKVFVEYPLVEKILGNGETKSSVWLKQGIQIDMRVIPNESFGTSLQYFTGNVDHNVILRKVAIKKHLKLSEYGVFNSKDENLAKGMTEQEVYKLLVGNYIIPEMRTDNNEIDLALQNKLPHPITLKDIKGDLQMHSTYSDGENEPEEMILKCISLGYEYMGFSDHVGTMVVSNSIREEKFGEYLDAILKLKEKYKNKIKVLAGCEANIKPNGELSYPSKLLEKLDYVLASPHSSFLPNAKLQTERYLRLLDNPLVKIVGHPTGRIIGKRKGFEFDFDVVFEKAAKNNIAFEINAQPSRLDLPYQIVLKAINQNCKLSINTDSHSVSDLDLMKYGVFVARKAGVEVKNLYFPLM